MAKSLPNFLKRKQKQEAVQPVEPGQEEVTVETPVLNAEVLQDAVDHLVEISAEPKKDNGPDYVGFDVYSPDGGKSFFAIQIQYNPITKEAKVLNQSSLSRLIALKYNIQKEALGILRSKKKE